MRNFVRLLSEPVELAPYRSFRFTSKIHKSLSFRKQESVDRTPQLKHLLGWLSQPQYSWMINYNHSRQVDKP